MIGFLAMERVEGSLHVDTHLKFEPGLSNSLGPPDVAWNIVKDNRIDAKILAMCDQGPGHRACLRHEHALDLKIPYLRCISLSEPSTSQPEHAALKLQPSTLPNLNLLPCAGCGVSSS